MKKPPTKYVYKTPNTYTVKPPTIKVVPTKPVDTGPTSEGATTTLNRITRGRVRPWTRLRKKI